MSASWSKKNTHELVRMSPITKATFKTRKPKWCFNREVLYLFVVKNKRFSEYVVQELPYLKTDVHHNALHCDYQWNGSISLILSDMNKWNLRRNDDGATQSKNEQSNQSNQPINQTCQSQSTLTPLPISDRLSVPDRSLMLSMFRSEVKGSTSEAGVINIIWKGQCETLLKVGVSLNKRLFSNHCGHCDMFIDTLCVSVFLYFYFFIIILFVLLFTLFLSIPPVWNNQYHLDWFLNDSMYDIHVVVQNLCLRLSSFLR